MIKLRQLILQASIPYNKISSKKFQQLFNTNCKNITSLDQVAYRGMRNIGKTGLFIPTNSIRKSYKHKNYKTDSFYNWYLSNSPS